MSLLNPTPYQKFIYFIAKLINGAYPEHYDTSLRTEIRATLTVSIAVLATIAFKTTDSILFKRITLIETPTQAVIGVFMLLLFIQLVRLATLRKNSIKQHILNTDYEEIIEETRSETVQDSNLLYDYIKVFFVLTVIFSIPEVTAHFIRTEVTQDIATVFKPLQLYYLLILVITGPVILKRWANQYYNDNSTPNKTNSNNSTNQ